MSIVRKNNPSRYLLLPAETLGSDLSMEALGLLVHLLSHPDDWEVRREPLARTFRVGQGKIRRVLAELERAGFLSLDRTRDKNGRYHTESVIFDTQQINLCGDKISNVERKTATVNPQRKNRSGFTTAENQHVTNNKLINTELANTNSHNTDTHTTSLPKSQPPAQERAEVEISHCVCVEFAKKIREGRVRSLTGLLAALSRAAGAQIFVTDEIAREAAAKGGYSGPWPPVTRSNAAEIARQAVRKRRDILARHARPGESWEDVEQRLAQQRPSGRH